MKPNITDMKHFIYAATTVIRQTITKHGKTEKNVRNEYFFSSSSFSLFSMPFSGVGF
jgi:hypothetical protein